MDAFEPSTFSQCARVKGGLTSGETRRIPCNEPEPGRYVTVHLNRKDYLTICEFQVHGTPLQGTGKSYLQCGQECPAGEEK